MMNKAKEAYNNNNFEDALHIYLDIWQMQSDNMDALEGVARSYYRLRHFDDAIRYCNQALSFDRSLTWPYLILSYIDFFQKKFGESKQKAQVAIERDPTGWETSFWWGSLLCHEYKTDEGLVFLEKAVAIEKDDWQLYNNLSIAYLNIGDMKKYYEARKQMNRLKPSISNEISIHLERWAKLYTIIIMMIHYIMVFVAVISKWQIFLVVPFIIDVLWLIAGVSYVVHRQFKFGFRIILLTIFYISFPVLAFWVLNK